MSVNRQLLWSSPVFTPPLHDCHVAVQKVAMGGPDAADSDEPVKVVAIVGAGLAGLAAANALRHSRNCRPLLLEASDSIGGRVRQISAGDGGVHEMGAEFFHGSSAAAKQLSDEFGLSTDQIFTTAHGDGGPDDEPAPDGGLGYYVAEDETVLPWDSTDRGFVALNDALDRMREYTGDDQMSVAAFLRAQGVPERMLSLAAASYSNTLGVGSDLESLPLRAVAHLERLWLVDGYGDFRLADDRTTGGGDGVGTPRGLGRLCAPLAHGIELRLSWPVATIATAAAETPSRRLIVTSHGGARLHVDSVIVAVPVRVLQQRKLTFSPPLPLHQQRAIDSIRVDGACKVVLHFSRVPWPEHGAIAAALSAHPLHSIISARGPVPELWFRSGNSGEWTASGFATGDFAAALGAMSQAAAAQAMLGQLAGVLSKVLAIAVRAHDTDRSDGHFSGAECDADELLSRLRARLVGAHVVDWAAEPWIGGGYSSPSFAELPHARAAYRSPSFGGLVSFCGEATEDACMTMSAAIESGRRAAQEVQSALSTVRGSSSDAGSSSVRAYARL